MNYLIKLHSFLSLKETMCKTHDSATQTQGPDYSYMVFTIEFRGRLISPEPFQLFPLNFIQETMCRIYNSVTQTLGQGYTSISCVSPFNLRLLHIP